MRDYCSLKIKNKVRIPINKGIFNKGYEVGWSSEIYEILKVETVSYIIDILLLHNSFSYNYDIIFVNKKLYYIIYSDWLDGRCLSLYCTNNAG